MTGKSLVIVESPNKIKKIQNFLGNKFIVKASCGHIRDLDRKELSIDTSNNFRPTYKTNSDKANVISDLKSAFRSCDVCYLASDLSSGVTGQVIYVDSGLSILGGF